MDKRLKHIDREAERVQRQELYRRLATGDLPIAEAVRTMRRLSHLTQPEFARHRGVSVDALRQIESGNANPTVETLNKIVSVYGLQVGFVPKPRDQA
jgi:DNA-binding transcriptional regulator YiaG